MAASTLRLPASAKMFDRDWLQNALEPGFPGAVVEAVSIANAHSGATGRARLSVAWQGKGSSADSGLPATITARAGSRMQTLDVGLRCARRTTDAMAEPGSLDLVKERPVA